MRPRKLIVGTAIALWLFGTSLAIAGTPYLVLYPRKWETAVTNYIAFKTRLGFEMYTDTVENVTGGDTNNYALVRSYLLNFKTNTVAGEHPVPVLFFGNYFSIPAPRFRILSGENRFFSDIYYRDLHTEFNSDGDDTFAEYGSGSTNDFDSTTFDLAFPAISNELNVGRIPIHHSWSAASAEAVLDHIMRFEREVSSRKQHALMSAGRIDFSLGFPDSWDYVLEDIVQTVTNTYPAKQLVTVVHVPPGYSDLAGMDYVVEGSDLVTDYTAGQDIIRRLWETNDTYSFLCNVSHGGAFYDFAIRRNGAGFPRNVKSAVMISMSCASYKLGKAALTNGLAATYLGSSATVTPDAITLLSGQDMVSAIIQQQAVLDLFCLNKPTGQTFCENFDDYISRIQTAGFGWFYGSNKDDILRNIVGFGLTGDPTLVHAYADTDSDGLLDPEETYLGTQTNNWDSDGDGLADGLEFVTTGYDPLTNDGEDVDGDGVTNEGEMVAGTDPFDEGIYPCMTNAVRGSESATFLFAFSSVTGRTYCLQTTSNLAGLSWADCTTAVTGTGVSLAFSVTNTTDSGAYYRLKVVRE